MVRFITGRMQEEKIKKQPPETAAYHSKGTRYRAFTLKRLLILLRKKKRLQKLRKSLRKRRLLRARRRMIILLVIVRA